MSKDNKRMYFVWEGENSNHRHVSSGTYLGIITFSSSEGHKQVKRVFIGVKNTQF